MSEEIRALLKLKDKKKDVILSRVSDLLRGGFDKDKLAEDFVKLNDEVWGSIVPSKYLWTKEQIMTHFLTCPDIIFCAFEKGRMVGTITNILTTEKELRRNKTWMEKTGDGFLTTHMPDGDEGFGVDLSVSKNASRKISDKLVLVTLLMGVIGNGLRSGYLGSRIPGYHKHKDMKAEDYVFGKRSSGKPLDPELYLYFKAGLKIIEIIPEYMDDPESLNYGVLIRWSNPLYKTTKAFPFLKPMIRWIGKKLFLRIP